MIYNKQLGSLHFSPFSNSPFANYCDLDPGQREDQNSLFTSIGKAELLTFVKIYKNKIRVRIGKRTVYCLERKIEK